jgi:hypothetical protein
MIIIRYKKVDCQRRLSNVLLESENDRDGGSE